MSYSSFNYDESISDSFGDASATGNNVYYNDADLEAWVVYIQGGDLRFTTVGLTAKIDFIPFSDTRKFSVYGIVRPFLQVSKRTEISATAELWYYNTIPPDDPSNWTFSSEEFLSVNTAGLERWAAETEISGGFNTGVGGELSFRSYKESYGAVNYNSSIISIAANGNYHFNTLLDIPSEWDFYAGLGLGYYIWNIDNDYPGSNNSGIGIGAQVGGRYFFNDNFGVNLELGGANVTSGAKIGITYKL